MEPQVFIVFMMMISSLESMPRNATKDSNKLVFSDVKVKAAIEIKAVEGAIPPCNGMEKTCNETDIQDTSKSDDIKPSVSLGMINGLKPQESPLINPLTEPRVIVPAFQGQQENGILFPSGVSSKKNPAESPEKPMEISAMDKMDDQENLNEGSNLYFTEISIIKVNPINNETLMEKVMNVAKNKVLSESADFQNTPRKETSIPLSPKSQIIGIPSVQDQSDTLDSDSLVKESAVDLNSNNQLQEIVRVEGNKMVKESESVKEQAKPKNIIVNKIANPRILKMDVSGEQSTNLGQPAMAQNLETLENLNIPSVLSQSILKMNPLEASNGINFQDRPSDQINGQLDSKDLPSSWFQEKLKDAKKGLEIPAAAGNSLLALDVLPIFRESKRDNAVEDSNTNAVETPDQGENNDKIEQTLTLHVPKNESIDLPISAPKGIKRLNLHIVLEDAKKSDQGIQIDSKEPFAIQMQPTLKHKDLKERNVDESEESINDTPIKTPEHNKGKVVNISVVLNNEKREIPSARYFLGKQTIPKQDVSNMFNALSNVEPRSFKTNRLIPKTNVYQEMPDEVEHDVNYEDNADFETLNKRQPKLPLMAVEKSNKLQYRDYAPRYNRNQQIPFPNPDTEETRYFGGPPKQRLRKKSSQ